MDAVGADSDRRKLGVREVTRVGYRRRGRESAFDWRIAGGRRWVRCKVVAHAARVVRAGNGREIRGAVFMGMRSWVYAGWNGAVAWGGWAAKGRK